MGRSHSAVTPEQFDAVLTEAAKVHAACSEKEVRRVSAEPATQTGEAFCPFDSDTDYKQVDGKLWYEGVRSFWASARKARQHSRSTMTGQRNQ